MTTLVQVSENRPPSEPQLSRHVDSHESLLATVGHTSGASVLQVILVVISTSLLARILGPDGKGTYDVYLAAAQLFYTCIAFSLPAAITYIVASGQADPRRLISIGYCWAAAQGITTYALLHFLQHWGLL